MILDLQVYYQLSRIYTRLRRKRTRSQILETGGKCKGTGKLANARRPVRGPLHQA